jgi:hypothetical protein
VGNTEKRKMDTSFTSTQQLNCEQQQQQPKHAAAKIIKPLQIIMYHLRDYDILLQLFKYVIRIML